VTKWMRRVMLGKPIKNALAGQGQVIGCSRPPYPMGRYVSGVKMNLIVHVEGREPYKLAHECTVPGEKHPRAGMMLPLLVDPGDQERVWVEWDRIPTPDEQFAEMPLGPSGPVQVVSSSSPSADPVERLEKLTRLRDAGVVSDAEFETLKAQILADP
jgi:hypothetical protein